MQKDTGPGLLRFSHERGDFPGLRGARPGQPALSGDLTPIHDVPYDEPPGYNPHHVLTRIREGDLARFPGAELFYQDGRGVIFDAHGQPPNPKIVVCVCSRPGAPRVGEP